MLSFKYFIKLNSCSLSVEAITKRFHRLNPGPSPGAGVFFSTNLDRNFSRFGYRCYSDAYIQFLHNG
jgi:hypothetical protein